MTCHLAISHESRPRHPRHFPLLRHRRRRRAAAVSPRRSRVGGQLAIHFPRATGRLSADRAGSARPRRVHESIERSDVSPDRGATRSRSSIIWAIDRIKAIGVSGGGIALLHMAIEPARAHRRDGRRQRAAVFSRAGARDPGAVQRRDAAGHGTRRVAARGTNTASRRSARSSRTSRASPRTTTTCASRRRCSRRSPRAR